MRRVVVTGIGLITPIGIGKEEFWKNNKEGKSGICDMPELEKFGFESKAYGYVKNFKPEQLGLTLREIRRMDRITQFGVLCTDQAVKDSKIDLSKIDKNRVGVNIANAVAGTKFMDEEFSVLTNNGKEVVNPEDISPYAYARSMPNTTSNEVSYRYGFNGTCCTMATGCTTGIDSIGFAYDQIRCGELDVMICGAAEAPITPITIAAFEAIGTLSTNNNPPEKASRPFDDTRNGFVLAEAAGILVLEELGHALNRGAHIYGEIAGYGSVNNAMHMTGLKPDGEDLSRAIKIAIEEANVTPFEIDYINAHGTSTHHNDLFETKAIKLALGDHANKVKINSTKSMIGHLLGAAGGVEFITCVKSIEDGYVHPTVGLETPGEGCDLDYTMHEGVSMDVNYAISNSLGFGGHNASLIVKKFTA